MLKNLNTHTHTHTRTNTHTHTCTYTHTPHTHARALCTHTHTRTHKDRMHSFILTAAYQIKKKHLYELFNVFLLPFSDSLLYVQR